MAAIATSFTRAALNWRRGAVISVEGVALSVRACGMGKEEDGVGGVWIT